MSVENANLNSGNAIGHWAVVIKLLGVIARFVAYLKSYSNQAVNSSEYGL